MANAQGSSGSFGERVEPEEVLLLFRAVMQFAALRDPACAPQERPFRSLCPLFERCPRWKQPRLEARSRRARRLDDSDLDTQAEWPCQRLLDVLDSEVNWVGQQR
jgi:hypothetical protein